MSRVSTGAEYALYWLAVNRPDILEEAEQFSAGMLVNRPGAYDDARKLLDRHESSRSCGFSA